MPADTTTVGVGLRTADGVVLAAANRAVDGTLVVSKDTDPIEPVHPTAALAVARAVGAGQAFVREVRSEADEYETERGEPMDVPALATAVGNRLRGESVTDLEPLLGGVDGDGAHLYQFGADGTTLEADVAATGVGRETAVGALERATGDDLSVEEGVPVAVDAVEAAIERSGLSGAEVVLARVTADGVDREGPAAPDDLG